APHAPHYEYIDISLNGLPHTPSHPMAEVQPIDGEYVGFWWPEDSDGYTFKITGKIAFDDAGQHKSGSPAWTSFRWYGESPEDVRYYFNPGENSEEDRLDTVVDFLRVFDTRQTPAAEFMPRLRDAMNLESSFRVFVCRDLIADWDTIGIGNGQNAYLYYAPTEGRMYLLPWDMDHAFERPDQTMLSSADPGFGRILREPEARRLYARILKEGLDGAFSAAVIDPWADRVHLVTGPGRTLIPTSIKSFLNIRRARATALIRSALDIELELLGGSVIGFVDGVARIEGTAPLEAASFLVFVDGSGPLSVTPRWRTLSGRATDIPTVWEIELDDLSREARRVDILVFGTAGDLLGQLGV